MRICQCGSEKERWPEYDARGIFLTYVCDDCRKEKLSHYRPEVLTDSNYDLMGETLDDDGGEDYDIERDLLDWEDYDANQRNNNNK
jgi:hypothetical protein